MISHGRAGDCVDVVHFCLDDDYDCDVLAGILDSDERALSARLPADLPRRRFIVAHGLMRIILGQYLGVPAASVDYATSPSGKPRLAGDADLQFNLSHSGDRAVLAIARGREVGVDLERHRQVEIRQLSRRFFARVEADALDALAPEAQLPAFFDIWARKESFLKATGHGLALPLDTFECHPAPAEPQVIVHPTARDADARWTVVGLPVVAGYSAALTAEGRGWRIESWVCSPRLPLLLRRSA